MADRNLDEYQELAFYKKHTKPKKSGFSEFDVDGVYYFCRHIDGEIALISQAYKGKSGRNNGIESVKKNSKIKERFIFDTRDGGKHGFSLLAGNRQEIGISPNYTSKKKSEFVAGRMNGSVKLMTKIITNHWHFMSVKHKVWTTVLKALRAMMIFTISLILKMAKSDLSLKAIRQQMRAIPVLRRLRKILGLKNAMISGVRLRMVSMIIA